MISLTVPATETHAAAASTYQGINFTQIWCIFKYSLRICWQVPHDRPNCQLSLKWYFISLHWQLHKLSCFHPYNRWKDVLNAHTLQLKSPYVLIEYHLKSCVLPWHYPWKLVSALHFHCSLPDLKQNLTQMCCSFLRKLRTSFNSHNNTHPLRRNAEFYDYKTYYTDSEDSDAMAPGGRKLYYVLFLVLVASLERFRYAFVHVIYVFVYLELPWYGIIYFYLSHAHIYLWIFNNIRLYEPKY